MKNMFTTITAVVLLLISFNASAVDPIYTPFLSNKAIRGYDTVAYFTEGKPVKGNKAHSTEYKGATWQFASKNNLDLFVANPEKYAPQYGGYCAYAVSQNTTASIEPEQFTVLDGKLYLNYNKKVNELWNTDREGFIAAANKNWPGILAK